MQAMKGRKEMRKLEQLMKQADHKSYPAYKTLKGSYDFPGYCLVIEHVQGDPYAAPSSLRIRVDGKNAGFPAELYQEDGRRKMLQDYLLRKFGAQAMHFNHKAKGSGKSGALTVSHCGQEVLERTGCGVDKSDGSVTLRFQVGFPAAGRTVLAMELKKILMEYLPECVGKALLYKSTDKKELSSWISLADDQNAIRKQLPELGLAAFVANGSCLPRKSGAEDTPMKDAVLFCSPKEQEVTLKLPGGRSLSGMGIKKGVTLIVGGGYHGKSTLLAALQRGVYDHIPGDGREYAITDCTAMKIRAEDGRSIKGIDISPFIMNLPNGKDTNCFSTEDASGSTSQAANVVEAVLAGSRVLLIDEDTSATNFMVRDELMQRVVHRDKEPVIPFIERVRELYECFGVSTVLVAGSSGTYFHMADLILQMDGYKPYDITSLAKKEAEAFPMLSCDAKPMSEPTEQRIPAANRKMKGDTRIKVKTQGTDSFSLNYDQVELRYVEQIIDPEQVNLLAALLLHLEEKVFDGKKNLGECLSDICVLLERHGIGYLYKGRDMPGNLAMPRKAELYACLNRYRGLDLRAAGKGRETGRTR